MKYRGFRKKIRSIFSLIPSYFEYHRDLAREETSLLFLNSYGGIFAALLNAVIFYILSSLIIPETERITYVLLNFAAAIFQVALIIFYDKKIRNYSNISMHSLMKNIFSIWIFFYGFLISSPLFFMNHDLMTNNHIYLILVALGMTAGSSATMGSVPKAHFLFSLGITSPVLWFFFTGHQKPMFGLGLMVIIYLGVMLYITLLLKKNALNAIFYRFQNKELLERLDNQTKEEFNAQEKFKKIFHNSPIAISISAAEDGVLLDVNEAFVDLTGYSRKESIGKTVYQLNVFEPNFNPTALINRIKEKGHLRDYEAKITRKDGNRVMALFFIEKILINEKNALLTMALDITHKKNKENELERMHTEAVDAAKAKTSFLATMSHEIRTPMNAIMGMTDLAFESDDIATIKEYLLTVKGSAKHLTTIINDILDFSKIESGRLELENNEIHIREMFQSIENIFRNVIEKKRITFTVDINDKTPETIMGDETRIRQVIINLLSNAAKFTSKGKIEVIVDLNSNKQLSVMIKDTGIGIPYHMQKDIFHRFKQAETSIARRFGGTGLGLAISKHLMTMMNGEIQLTSKPGHGSIFTMLLPDIRPELQIEEKEKLPASDSIKIKTNSMNILLVEDNEDNIKLASIVLKKASHRLYVCRNGNEALEILSNPDNDIDIVLMDIEMPILDGIETTKLIRSGNAGNRNSEIPIIAMTAHAIQEIKDRSISAGMDGYIIKPINISELENEILRIMSEKLEKTV